MALTPLTERQKTIIINNIVKATSDISKLNKQGYSFISNASGFIAHYNLHGFIEHFEDYDLKRDILNNQRNNQWNNFRPDDKDYEYYKSKRDVYNRICQQLN